VITSTANDKVKLARALHRRRYRYRERRFLVEGVRLLEEVTRAGLGPAFVLYSADLFRDARGRALLDALRLLTDAVLEVDASVLQHAADTVTPQGVLAVVPFPELEPVSVPGLAVVVDGLQDPGNLGTLLRTAEAAGVGHVLLAPGTVDPYNPKVVRGAAGAHFRLPITVADDWEQVGARVHGRAIWLADPGAELAYYDADWTRPSALIIGSEAHGAGPEAKRIATGRLVIPMVGEAESLNAAVSAAVILFEARRQRSSAG
jgi:TrmH family RNA methyltransferase